MPKVSAAAEAPTSLEVRPSSEAKTTRDALNPVMAAESTYEAIPATTAIHH
jgi:hypothetical protein